MKRLAVLSEHRLLSIAEMASLLLDVARVRAHRRKRVLHLAKAGRHDLIQRLEAADFIGPRIDIESEEFQPEPIDDEVADKDDLYGFHWIELEESGVAERMGFPPPGWSEEDSHRKSGT